MGWFGITTDKDPKEAAYNRGEKSFKDVIQNESSGELLYAIDPREDFNTGSTLIVHPGEVALFEKNGVIQQEFLSHPSSHLYQLTIKVFIQSRGRLPATVRFCHHL